MSKKISQEKRLVYSYIQEWREILFATKPINQRKATELIKKSYHILDLAEPKIIFCESPLKAQSYLTEIQPSVSNYHHLKHNLSSLLDQESITKLRFSDVISSEISTIWFSESSIFEDVACIIYNVIDDYIDSYVLKLIDCELSISSFHEYDFYIKELNCNCNPEVWNVLRSLAQECPYILSFTEICLVIERPTQLYLDQIIHPHAEGKPAVSFIDGYNIYAYHGTTIPEKYGKYVYSQWQPQWLLEEKEEELRSVLVRGIGYERFRQELPESDFDFWQDYEVLIIEALEKLYTWLGINCPEGLISSESGLEFQELKKLTQSLPFKISKEISKIYQYFNGNIEIAPNLFLYSFEEIVKEYCLSDWIKENTLVSDNYAIPLFHGVGKKFYYILSTQEEKDFSEIWYVSEYSQPKICATNLTSLLLTIVECYETGGYFVTIDEKTGVSHIEQDRNKIEKIFRKFNPDYLYVWQEIWL